MLPALLDETRRLIAESLADPVLARVAAALRRRDLESTCDGLLAAITTANGLQGRLNAIKRDLSRGLEGAGAGAFERVLLLRRASAALQEIPGLPVGDGVKHAFCDEFRFVARPPQRASFDVSRGSFVSLCEVATLRRFPAGQFHFARSGLPRSWVLKVKGRQRLVLLYWIARRLGGVAPVFFPHLNPNRENRRLIELEANRSYYRMAQSLAQQPDVRGIVASSWLRSPDTFKVSPHLAWMNATMLANGGLVVIMGPADPNEGVLAKSAERRAQYEAGTFRPTTGLAIWPRDAVLAWAARHPELGQEPTGAVAGRSREPVVDC